MSQLEPLGRMVMLLDAANLPESVEKMNWEVAEAKHDDDHDEHLGCFPS